MHHVTITFGIENNLQHEDLLKRYSALLAPKQIKRVSIVVVYVKSPAVFSMVDESFIHRIRKDG